MNLAALVAFVAGVCVLQWQATLPSVTGIAVFAGAALLMLAVAVRLDSRPIARAAVLIAIASFGFAYAAGWAVARLSNELAFDDERRDIAVVGVVASLPVRLERGVRFEFDVERVLTPDVSVPPRVLLGWYSGNIVVKPGERWMFSVRLKRPHGTLNPGGFDFEAWMLERDLRASGYVRAGRSDPPRVRTETMVWQPGYSVQRARAWLRDRLQPQLADKRYGGVLLALVLGDQRAISAADWTLFNRTGIGHLVSISGLHITMIAGLVGLIVGVLWRRSQMLLARSAAQTAAVLAGLTAAFLYALLAGWGVPAQRTVVMLATVGVAWLFQSRIGAATSLALAATLVCLLDPWAVLAPGFWLSFGAVAAIVWVVQGRHAPSSTFSSVLHTAARVQIAVTLALIPATVLLFHQLSIVSPIANAIAIPLVSWAVTPLALIAAALAILPSPLSLLSEPMLGLDNAIFSVLAFALEWAGSFKWAALPVATPPLALIALAGIGIVWLLAPPGWPVRFVGVIALVPMFVWPAARAGADEMWVTAIDVGQGAAVLVETADQVWLYDAGPRYSIDSDAGERVILPYLRHRGIGRLDGLIVSHLDSDHSGGAASILRAVEVGRVISSIGPRHAALGARAEVERCESGMQWRSGALTFEILHPTAADYEVKRPTNSLSCVVLIMHGATRLLLTGDVSQADEAALLARAPSLRATWLGAPHHGSRGSSSEALLEALGASSAVAQTGYRNRFRHPDPEVVERYRAQGIVLFRTDYSGAIQWRFAGDGRGTVSASRDADARYWHNRPGAVLPQSVPAPAAPDADAPDASPGPPEPLVRG